MFLRLSGFQTLPAFWVAKSFLLINDKQGGAFVGMRAVRRIAVADVIALVGPQREALSILQFHFERSGEAIENVSLGAPVVGAISGGVLDDAHANIGKILRSPQGKSCVATVTSGFEAGPVGDGHRQRRHFHGESIRGGGRVSVCTDENE